MPYTRFTKMVVSADVTSAFECGPHISQWLLTNLTSENKLLKFAKIRPFAALLRFFALLSLRTRFFKYTKRDSCELFCPSIYYHVYIFERQQFVHLTLSYLDERKLGPDELPLLVQLNWNMDDREGRFLLRRMDEKTYVRIWLAIKVWLTSEAHCIL